MGDDSVSYLFIWLIYSRTDSWPSCQSNTARLSQGRPGEERSWSLSFPLVLLWRRAGVWESSRPEILPELL